MRVLIFTRKQSHLTDRFQMTVMCHKNSQLYNIHRLYYRYFMKKDKQNTHNKYRFPAVQIIL